MEPELITAFYSVCGFQGVNRAGGAKKGVATGDSARTGLETGKRVIAM